MIPVLRSIDTLLNRFDELSKRHANLLSNFNINFPDIENPLRDIARDEEEQRKTTANILLVLDENDDQIEPTRTIENFHRRIIKSRYLHRPPNYFSNDNSLFHRVPSGTSTITSESASFLQTSQTFIKANTPQPVIPISNNDIIERKVKLTKKIKPKVVPQNPPALQRYARSTVTAFTMETVNRLSKPKTHHQVLPEQKPTIKHVQRRPKPYENIKKEAFECSTLSSIPPPPIKRTKTTTIKPFPKKVKVENRIPIQTPNETLLNNFSRPLVFVASAPTIRLNFPMQQQQQSSRIVTFPKIATMNKRSMIHLKT